MADSSDSERPVHRAPAAGEVVREHFSSDEIFQRIIAAADEEMSTGPRELFFSGLAAGFAITITFLLYASGYAAADGAAIAGAVLYPLGFVYIILGDYQLYTENTLPPVALVLERLASVSALLTVWGIVLLGNLLGSAIGAFVLANTGVLSPDAAAAATSIAQVGVETSSWDLFFKACFAGLIVAGVVWLDYAAQDTVSRLALVYMAFLAIPLGNLYHVVVSATEAMYLIFNGELAVLTGFSEFLLPVLLGNTLGGVLLVTVVNYFQTAERTYYDEASNRLSLREWLLGGRDTRTDSE